MLRGLSRFKPQPGRPALQWVISHPDLITPAELGEFDHVFVASRTLAQEWASHLGPRVEALLQCTDPEMFYPAGASELPGSNILFVGNSRKVYRPVVRAAIEAGLSFDLYGTRWEELIDPKYVLGATIPNAKVGDLYRQAGVVLNDHWPDMQRTNLVSNRVFDVLACGRPLVSDELTDLPDGFGAFIETFGPDRPIAAAVARALAEDDTRRAERRAFSDIVRREHSFDRRAEVLVARVRRLLASRERARTA